MAGRGSRRCSNPSEPVEGGLLTRRQESNKKSVALGARDKTRPVILPTDRPRTGDRPFGRVWIALRRSDPRCQDHVIRHGSR